MPAWLRRGGLRGAVIIKKMVVGVRPATKLRRVWSGWGAAADAIITALALAWAAGALAQTGDTDWRSYGVSQNGKDEAFFDAAGVVRRPNGHVEVWTKELSLADITRAASAESTRPKILELAQQILASRQQPGTSSTEARTGVAIMEAAANVGGIEPVSRTLFELDCANRRMRILSVHAMFEGKPLNPLTVSDWAYPA